MDSWFQAVFENIESLQIKAPREILDIIYRSGSKTYNMA